MKTGILLLGLAMVVSQLGANEKKPQVELPRSGSVKADPAPKRNPFGDKVSDNKPSVKTKPAKVPPLRLRRRSHPQSFTGAPMGLAGDSPHI